LTRKVETEVVLGLIEEARGYLPAIRQGIEDFRGHPDQVDRLEEAHRHVHTIKGACAMVGLAGLSHLAYLLEEALEDLATGSLAMGEETAKLLLTSVGWIEARLEGVLRGDPEDEALLAEATRAYRRLRGQPEEGDAEAVAEALATLAPESEPRASARVSSSLADARGSDQPAESEPRASASGAPVGPAYVPELPSEVDLGAPDLSFPELPDLPAEAPAEEGASAEAPVPPELLEIFTLEADEHLRNISAALPALEQGGDTRESVQAIRRSAHTLKGTAAMVGFRRVTQLAHRMEDLLDLLYEGRLSVTPEIVRLLFASTDALEDLAAGRPANGLSALYDTYSQVLAAVPPAAEAQETAAPEGGPAREEAPAQAGQPAAAAVGRGSFVRVPIERLDEMVKLVSELVIARSAFEQRLRDYAHQVDELKRSTERLRQVSHKLESGYESSALAGGPRSRYYVDLGDSDRPVSRAELYGFDDLEFDNYTEFHLQSRALAETTADVQTVASDLGQALGDFDGFLGREARLTGEIEDKLMRLRMVPLSTLAPRLQRTVRTVAEQLGKSAELVLEGEATELDKTVLEEMADPLLHLLRNAVDHGIEAPEERRRLGKPERGVVRLRAGHEGSQIVLRIADDGAGLDPERLRAAAVQKGLLSAAEAAALRDEDLHSLVFLPGFSTAAAVSEVSGRGVGLDVVRSQVHKLKGSLTVEGRPGTGATFTVRLPMTLAITRALLVKSHQETFAIPLDAVQQILRLEGEEVERLGQEPVLRVGGQVYPVVSLGRVLNLRQPADASVTRPPVVILKVGDRQVALVVEHLLGGREIVIKSLGSHLRQTPGVTGATLTGDGRVVLILSPAELVGEGGWANARFPARPAPAPAPQAPAAREELTVMVVDDSPSVRRVLSGLIQRAGWNAVEAKDGLEALELLHGSAELPDLVLLDVEMPRMDGYELLSTLRSQPAYRDLPVVMVTSRAGEKHRRKALDTGASAYVVKPYQDEDLLAVIRRLVRDARQAALA
jgi:chemosensory pili system protein ChpA (sensor histidine kinase/response regulator)